MNSCITTITAIAAITAITTYSTVGNTIGRRQWLEVKQCDGGFELLHIF
jgi:hypothetical protein